MRVVEDNALLGITKYFMIVSLLTFISYFLNFPVVVPRDLQLIVLLNVFLHLPKEDENLLLEDLDQTVQEEEVDQRVAGTALNHPLRPHPFLILLLLNPRIKKWN